MQELANLLKKNFVVAIAAIGASERPFRMPFLGGELSLALGAPTLSVTCGVPLVPVFTVPDASGGFEVIVEPALTVPERGTSNERISNLARQYADVLEGYVKRYPSVWRGWFAPTNWQPSDS